MSLTEPGGIVKQYTYDWADNRSSLTIKQNGQTKTNTEYTYDKMNRLYQGYENGQLTAAYGYDQNGNRISLQYANGDSTEYTYTISNKLDLLTNKKGSQIISQYEYAYGPDGSRVRETDKLSGKVTTYTYDGVGRLVSEQSGSDPEISYTYDDRNNRKTMSIEGVSLTNYVYDANNRLTAETKITGQVAEITRYSYDNNGNQVYKAAETIKSDDGSTSGYSASVSGESPEAADVSFNEYDGLNRLVKTTEGDKTITYTYNANGLRTSKTVNGATTRHIWDGDQMALELDGAGTLTKKYVRGINLIYAQDTAGIRKYYLYDGHGDVIQLTDSTGNVIKNYEYDAFGNEKNPDPDDTNVFRYCGEYFDKETGTIYLRARYYDPEIGRFISEDSYWGEDDDPLSLNLYTYAHNNPIMFIDPTGHSGDPVDWFFRRVNDGLWNIDTNVRAIGSWVQDKFNSLNPEARQTIAAAAKSIDDSIFFGIASNIAGLDDNEFNDMLETSQYADDVYKVMLVACSIRGSGKSPIKPNGLGIMGQTKQQLLKSKTSFEKLIQSHKNKLDEYIKNPDAFDNQGLLKNAKNSKERQKIIDGRIEQLNKQITKQQGELGKITQRLKELN